MNNKHIHTYRDGKFFAVIEERGDRTRYPNYPYVVTYNQETPKGRYSKVKVKAKLVYSTLEQADANAKAWLQRIQKNIEAAAAYKAEKLAANKAVDAADFYKIGDIIYDSWGWEQTNIDWYQVVGVTARKIRVRRIHGTSHQREGFSSMSAFTEPVKDAFVDSHDKFDLLVKAGGDLASRSYHCYRKWDGQPKYYSWYA